MAPLTAVDTRIGNTSYLRAARHAAGLSLRDVEDAVGISRSNLSQLERGICGVSLPALALLADLYGMTALTDELEKLGVTQ